jgi:guanine deaminase
MSDTDRARDAEFIRQAIGLAAHHMRADRGGPFGALIVRDNQIIGTGYNQVTAAHDPTAHAEIVAIRQAAQRSGSFKLTGCVLYSSCEPCPMCLAAAWWARLARIVYAAGRADAAAAGFDDERFWRELARPPAQRHLPATQLLREEALVVFEQWTSLPDKTTY